MILTTEERIRFVAWLLRSAESDRILAEQARKLSNPIMKQIAEKQEADAAAKERVAQILGATESHTIVIGHPATDQETALEPKSPEKD